MKKAIKQSLKMSLGVLTARFANGFRLPSKKNYRCKCNYILPFEGKWTVANGSPDKEWSHSWFIPSQRYAYDFLILDDDGKSFQGDMKSPDNYYCYAKNVLAPCDGEVVEMFNGCSDAKIEEVFKVDWSVNDVRGNYIIIKHSDKEYSLLAHLMPDSITVSAGDKVSQGQVIAKCGNSGNSTEPHLHFQLQRKQSFFTTAGLPILFSNIEVNIKNNFSIYDKRSFPTEIQKEGSLFYICRGQEVNNAT